MLNVLRLQKSQLQFFLFAPGHENVSGFCTLINRSKRNISSVILSISFSAHQRAMLRREFNLLRFNSGLSRKVSIDKL